MPGQVIVSLEYSYNLGEVTSNDLADLLTQLSGYKGACLQWTLSAPIQPAVASEKVSTTTGSCSANSSSSAIASHFCMTNPATPCEGQWPDCVTNKFTDTILINYWFEGTSVDQEQLSKLDTFVKGTVCSWVETTLKFLGQVWVVSRYTQQLTIPKPVKDGSVEDSVTFDEVMAKGYD